MEIMEVEGMEIIISFRYVDDIRIFLYGHGSGDENNALFKHSQDKHDGKFVEYEMEIVKQHFSAFSRLIHESVRINRNAKNPQISVLNSKSEWGFNKLPRLVVEKDERTDNKAEQEKNDNDLESKKGFVAFDVDGRQSRFQSSNFSKNLFKSWTPSMSAAHKPNATFGGETADIRHSKQMTMNNFFRNVVK